ncbi:DNA repair exonuclease [Candidatus Bipolaricaulota bacterium]|nr:DNA repair exonuclease [Candidatus Bipolaricaulota bacterium]MBS3791966.1 DNA repair exonuclease [Candidatus Bipolaricaulota bacterium]
MIREPVEILCTGDLHLGRHPTNVPDTLDESSFSPGRIWLQLVEKAIGRNAEAVILAGDIIDRRNRLIEAFGDFEAGVKELTRAGIPVYATSGNHDFDVLPDLLTSLSDYDISLLGENGEWETVQVYRDGAPVVRLAGWSFPDQHVNYDPLEKLDLKFTDELPVIGVLHGDVGRANGRYAPITSSKMERPGYDGWLVGHIHNSDLPSDSDPVVLIPGTPQPLDPTERGLHGPWALTIDEGGVTQLERLPVANLRYEKVTVDAGEMNGLEGIPKIFYAKTEEIIKNSVHSELKLLVVTLELTGRTDIYGDLEGAKEQLAEDLPRESGGTGVTVASVINRTLPPIDLEEVARGNSPPAVLAELLLKLERGQENQIPEELLQKSQEALTETYYANAYRVLRTQGELSPPGKETALEILERQGWKILDCLLSQGKT